MTNNRYCEVQGIGKMPESFYVQYDGVNFETLSTTKQYNEQSVFATCDREDFFDDDFNISGYKMPGGYVLHVNFNSEVGQGLFNNGSVTLFYKESDKRWTMMTASSSDRAWRFCSPEHVVELIEKGLRCYEADSNQDNEVRGIVARLANSLDVASKMLLSTSAIFAGPKDCRMAPKASALDVGDDAVYPGW